MGMPQRTTPSSGSGSGMSGSGGNGGGGMTSFSNEVSTGNGGSSSGNGDSSTDGSYHVPAAIPSGLSSTQPHPHLGLRPGLTGSTYPTTVSPHTVEVIPLVSTNGLGPGLAQGSGLASGPGLALGPGPGVVTVSVHHQHHHQRRELSSFDTLGGSSEVTPLPLTLS